MLERLENYTRPWYSNSVDQKYGDAYNCNQYYTDEPDEKVRVTV